MKLRDVVPAIGQEAEGCTTARRLGLDREPYGNGVVVRVRSFGNEYHH